MQALIGFVCAGVHIGYIEDGALDGDELVVDLGAVDGVEGVDLATVGGVDLMEGFDPADAGEGAVVVGVEVAVGVGDGGGGGGGVHGRDDGGDFGAKVEAGEAVVVLVELGSLAGGTELGADPEGVVVGEEEAGVVAVGDAVFAGDGESGLGDGGEEASEEAIGHELLAGEVEGGAIGDGGGDTAGDGEIGGDGIDVREGGGDGVDVERAEGEDGDAGCFAAVLGACVKDVDAVAIRGEVGSLRAVVGAGNGDGRSRRGG